jgi:hypothetical protein
MRVSVWGAHGILWFWVGRRTGGRRGGDKGGRRGRSKGRRRGGGKCRRRDGGRGRRRGRDKGRRRGRSKGGRKSGGQWLNSGSLSLIRWKLISMVERRESFRVRRGFRRGFGWF